MRNKRIFLVGFMGSGKSTVAKRLARELKYKLCDLDLEIELRLHQKVEEIFAHQGEHYFRNHEQIQLHRSGEQLETVFAVGGGTPCFYDNMEWMKKHGLCIYLEMSPKSLLNRLTHSKKNRPLLNGMNEEELLAFIEHKLEERKPFYEQAHLKINGHRINFKALGEKILNFPD